MITDTKIASLKPGAWLRDPAPRGAGRLLVRKTAAGATVFYFRYTPPTGKRDTLPIGAYHAKSKGGISLKEARQKAGELSRLYQSGVRNIRDHLEPPPNTAAMRPETTPDAQHLHPQSGSDGTLKSLIDGYVEQLTRSGKASAKTIRYLLYRFVVDRFPELCSRQAASLTASDFRPVLADMIQRKIGRTTAVIRSYLHAAYAAAMRAENDPSAPDTLLGFRIEYNPLSGIPALSQFNVAGERALSERELGEYLREVRQVPQVAIKSALLLALLLGGQRMRQLLRLLPSEVDLDGYPTHDVSGNEISVKTITLRDPKGRRKVPRPHLLPLFGEAEDLVCGLLAAHAGSAHVFTCDGRIAMSPHTASHAVSEIATKLLKEGRINAKFRLADIRRTCETQLAKLKVHKDIRAQLQSHGLGGVQNRHYDKHDYFDEKFLALAVWVAAIARIEAETADRANTTPNSSTPSKCAPSSQSH